MQCSLFNIIATTWWLLAWVGMSLPSAEAGTLNWDGGSQQAVEPVIEGYFSFQTEPLPEPDWQPLGQLDLDGYQASNRVLHLRFGLHNATADTQLLWLAIDASFLNYLSITIGDRHWLTGEDLPFDTRPIPHSGFVFPVTLAPGETVPVRAWVKSTLLDVPVTLWEPAAFFEHAQGIGYRDMLYFGLMITLVVYCLLLYFATRVFAYFSFAVFAAAQAFFFSLIFGYSYRFGWPDSPHWNSTISSLSLYALAFSLGWMSLHMLGTDRRPPKLYKVMRALLIALPLAWVGLSLFADRSNLMAFPGLWTLVVLTVIVTMLWLEIRDGSIRARLFAISWTPMLFGALAFILSTFGFFEYSQGLISLMLACMAATSLLLSFIIALYIRESVNRRQRLEQETLQLKAKQTERLEKEVERRTAQLEESNRRLNQLALTDPLTGLPNRRQLDDFGELHHRLQAVTGSRIYVAIFDLDHFKSINDRFGHDIGDEVLKAVAGTLTEYSRSPQDHANLLAGRLGGEEFALVGYNLEAADFSRLLESIRQAIANLRFNRMPGVQLTVSIGWAPTVPGESLSSAFRQADLLLYQAKTGGRNRICGS